MNNTSLIFHFISFHQVYTSQSSASASDIVIVNNVRQYLEAQKQETIERLRRVLLASRPGKKEPSVDLKNDTDEVGSIKKFLDERSKQSADVLRQILVQKQCKLNTAVFGVFEQRIRRNYRYYYSGPIESS